MRNRGGERQRKTEAERDREKQSRRERQRETESEREGEKLSRRERE